jgi:hypothetical protein
MLVVNARHAPVGPLHYSFGGDVWREGVERYRHWARAHGLVTKLHAGGTSFQGDSVAATGKIVIEVAPDLYAHTNGGPNPLSDTETMSVIEETNAFIEVIPGGNAWLLGRITGALRERGELGRLTVGTDSSGGNGIAPRGPLQAIVAIPRWEKWMRRPPSDAGRTTSPDPTRFPAGRSGLVSREHHARRPRPRRKFKIIYNLAHSELYVI